MTTRDQMDAAMRAHQTGRLAEAEIIYKQILSVEPNNPDALHLLGVVAFQAGRKEAALGFIQRAIAILPSASYLDNLGRILRAMGRMDEAIAALRQAAALDPADPQIQSNLANALREPAKTSHAQTQNSLGLSLYSQGRLEEAEAAFQSALALDPSYADAHMHLGNVFYSQRRLADAEAAYRAAIQCQPDHVHALSNLGGVLTDLGRLDEAIDLCSRAVAAQPSQAGAHNNLGRALNAKCQYRQAIDSFRQALALQPDLVEAHTNLGNSYLKLYQFREAEAAYRTSIALREDNSGAYGNLGAALREMGRTDESIAACRRAIALQPKNIEAYSNLGNTLYAIGRLDEAIVVFEQALEMRPDYPEALNNLGNTIKDLAQIPQAIACFDRVLAVRPGNANTASNRVFTMAFHPRCTALQILAEARKWNEKFAEPLAHVQRPHDNSRDPQRRLRIGYVSPDFREHCQAFLFTPLLANHDHDQVEVFCYSAVFRPDAVTQRQRGLADHWRDVVAAPDEELAAMIRQDRIDILVDLSMHMALNRLLVFARKPAPVQVSWLSYPGTTGVRAIDYRLTDPFLDPPGEIDALYSEQSLHLPDTFWCYDPLANQLPILPLPAERAGHITFGCLNNFCKITGDTLNLWAGVLRRVPGSRLLLLAPEGRGRRQVLDKLPGDRVDFVDRQPHPQYIATYQRIDIGLDTLPYNGHTTSLDSFYMGVPIVTLLGPTVVGRAGWSQLSNLNLSELAATTPERFVTIAAELAGDIPRLSKLRAGLRGRMVQSPLMDAKRFARGMEAAYRRMWRTWCAGGSP